MTRVRLQRMSSFPGEIRVFSTSFTTTSSITIQLETNWRYLAVHYFQWFWQLPNWSWLHYHQICRSHYPQATSNYCSEYSTFQLSETLHRRPSTYPRCCKDSESWQHCKNPRWKGSFYRGKDDVCIETLGVEILIPPGLFSSRSYSPYFSKSYSPSASQPDCPPPSGSIFHCIQSFCRTTSKSSQ